MSLEVKVYIGVFLFSLLMVLAMKRGSQEVDPMGIDEAKKALLGDYEARDLHNKIYKKEGERRWEEELKPKIMKEVTLSTIRETGNLFPGWEDVAQWSKDHPDKVIEILKSHQVYEIGR